MLEDVPWPRPEIVKIRFVFFLFVISSKVCGDRLVYETTLNVRYVVFAASPKITLSLPHVIAPTTTCE